MFTRDSWQNYDCRYLLLQIKKKRSEIYELLPEGKEAHWEVQCVANLKSHEALSISFLPTA